MKNLNIEKSDIIQLLYSGMVSPKFVNNCKVYEVGSYRIANVGSEYLLNSEYKVKCTQNSPLTFKLI